MRNKKGISLITLIITIIVMIILAGIIIMTFNNTNVISNSNETKYKNDLKRFDEEIRASITNEYFSNDNIIYEIIEEPSEIEKYSKALVESEYINYAYISNGELTLKGKMLSQEQRQWAREANIKIDDEVINIPEEKVKITISETEYTQGPITANLSYSNIPFGYELQYKIGTGNWLSGDKITNITQNCMIYARLYNDGDEKGLSFKNITNIDKVAPTVEKIDNPEKWSDSKITVTVIGATDVGAGLADMPYSFEDGVWQIENSKIYTENTSDIIIKVKDKVGNIYTHTPINVTRIDKKEPTIESVTGNASELVKGSVILKVNGAKDGESGLDETAYSFDNGASWQKSNEKEFNNNISNVVVKVRDAVGNIYTHAAIDIVNIDNEGPDAPTGITVTPYINKLVVQGKGSKDTGSGLAGYKYSLDNNTWTDMIPETQTYEYTNIKSSTSKTIYVKAVDKLGNESQVYGPVNASTLSITDKVAINLSTDKPTQGPMSVDLVYNNVPSGYQVQYKLEDQTKYTAGTKITEINENTVIFARLYNEELQDEVAFNNKEVTNIDREEPTIANISGNPIDWINTDVTLTINGATDNSGMLADKPYSFDNGVTWQMENSKIYTENASNIIIKVKDYAGNIYTCPTINVEKIDKKPPTITNVIGNPIDWVNTDVTLAVVDAEDDMSGLHKTQTYSFDGGKTWQTSNTKTYTENTSNVIIKVKDAIGNIYTHAVIDITKIDKEAPSKPTQVVITSGLNTITVKASGSTDSGSGLAGYKYRLGENGTWSNTIAPDMEYTFEEQIKSGTTVNVYVKAVDKLGWESSEYGPVNGATSSVTNKVSITLSTEEYTQGPITAELSYTDIPSGYVLQYKIGTGSWTTGTKTPDITSNTTVYARLYNKDLDDEIANNSKSLNNIDGNAPSITSVTGNPTSWTKDDVTLIVNGATDDKSGLHETETYSFDGGKTWQKENTKTYTDNTSNIIIKVKDKAGNIYTHTAIDITKIDKEIPSIAGVTGNPTSWTKDDVTLAINGATDDKSGLHETETYSFDGGTTWQTSNTKTYTENTSNIIIKVKDAVGNVYTHTAINIVYIDKEAPKVVFGTNGNNTASKTASTKVTVTDDGSLNSSSLKYLWTTRSSGITASSFTGNKSGTFSSGDTLSIPSNCSGEYYLYIYCEDVIGNAYIAKSNKFIVGNILPDATITQDIDSSTYTKEDITLTIKPYSPTVLYDNGYLLRTVRDWFGSNFPKRDYGGMTLNMTAKVHTIETADSSKTTGIGLRYTYDNDGTATRTWQQAQKFKTGDVTSGWTDIGGTLVIWDNFVIDNNGLCPFIQIGIDSSIKTGYQVEYKDIQYELYDPEKIKSVTVNGTNVSIKDGVGTCKITENGTYNIVITDIYGNTKTITKSISNIDKEAPSKPTAIDVTPSFNSITVQAKGSIDSGSGLAGYKYSLDNTDWTDLIVDGNAHTFESIKSGSPVKIYVKAVDNLDWESSVYGPIDSATIEVTNKVTITLSTEEYTKGPITADLSYTDIPTGYVLQYKLGDGEWIPGNQITNITANNTIYARLYNKDLEDELANNSKSFNNIDSEAPSITSVTGNATSWTKNDVTLTINGASDTGSGLHATETYSFDNGVSWQTGNTKTYTENTANIIIKVKDKVGNIYTHEAINIIYIDKEAPSITNVTGNPTTWIKDNVTLTINGASDTGSGLHATETYSFDGGKTWQTGNTKTYTENVSNIIIKVKDKLGNIYTHQAINITKIDKDIPIITSVTGNPTTWTKNDVTLTINYAKDDASGLHATEPYSFDGGKTWQTGNTKTYTENVSNIIIKVKDKLGNIYTHPEINIIYIDKDAPTIASVSGNPTTWIKDDVTLTVNSASDTGSGLHATESYSFDGGKTWQTSNKKTYAENTSGIVIKVKDKVGNIYTHNTINITYIDKDAPSITSVTGNVTEWTKNNVTLTINGAKDTGSGLHATETYSFDGGTTWQKENTKTYTENKSGIVIKIKDKVGNIYTHNTINVSYIDKDAPSITSVTGNPTTWTKNDVTLTINDAKDTGSGLHTTEAYSFDGGKTWQTSNKKVYTENTSNIIIKVKDKLGNIYTHNTINVTYIDKDAPTITSVTGNPTTWTKNNVTLTVNSASDTGSGLHATETYSFDGGKTWQTSNKKTYTENVSNIIIKVKDKLGNIYTHPTINITYIDKSEPSITSVTGNPTTWTKNDVTLTINGAKDTGSGLHATETYSFDGGTTWQTGNTKTYTGNTTGIVIKVKDKLGNIYTHPEINIIYIDKDEPTIASVSGNPTTWTKNDVTLTVNSASDTASGLHATEPYSFDGGKTWQTSNKKTYADNTSGIVIKVKDKVGNIYTHNTINITYIDKGTPSITSVTGNPTTWTKGDVTLTINGAKDTGSGLHATETYSFDGGSTWQISNKKTYTKNTSNILIKVKDKLGNIYTHNAINIQYIDKEAPSKPTAISVTTGLNTVTAKASGSTDSGSDLAGYKYKLGEDGTWSNTISPGTAYTFEEQVKADTTVNVYAKAVDKLGWESSEYGPVNGTTSIVTNKVTITLSTEEYTQGPITADLSYTDIPTGYRIEYKIGTGKWTPGTKTTDISSNTTIYARLYNESLDDEIASNSKGVSIIDKSAPSITSVTGNATSWTKNSLTLKINGASDTGSGLHATEPYSFDGGATWQTANTKTYTSNKSGIVIKVKDKAGNIYTHDTINIVYIDKSAPTITSVTGNPTTWTKNNVTLTINGAKDTISGLHATEPYSFDGGKTWQTANTKTYTENTAGVVIKVKDKAGNIYTHTTIDIIYIDKSAPTITSVTGNPTTWTKNNVTLTINSASDTGSGLHATETYSFDGGTTWQTSNKKTYTENTSGIVIKVKDKAGNIYTHDAINIVYIDKSAPTITSVTGNPTTWTKSNVTLTINSASDTGSGLHATETYSFDGGATWQTSNKKTYTENTSGIVIKVKDKVGNIYTHSTINITYIDKGAPSKPTAISITPTLNTITVKASGSSDSGSGLTGYKYKLGENGTWSSTIASDTNHVFENIKSNTTVNVYAKAVDKLGWESSEYGPVNGKTSAVTNKVVITLSTDSWTKGPIKATLSYDNIPTGYTMQYKIGTGNWTSGTKTSDISSNTTIYGRLYNSTAEDEIANNSKSVSNIDNEPPTDPTGLQVVTRNRTSIVVKASGSTDSGSGLAGYQYSINGTNWSATIASGTNHTINSLTENTQYTVYVRAIDKLQNISTNNYPKNTSTLSTYKVTYNSNTTDTVSNMPTTQTKVEGVTLKLSTSTPERAGYIFKGWATASNGSVAYGVGANYTNNNAVTLYAVWQAAYYQNIITSKIYVTLNEAITDSATNTQINVIRNATEKETATNTSGKTITLNLNNKTISFNDGYSLKNQGVMTLIGTGKITANSGITVNNTGTLNVNLDNETGYNDGTGGIIEMTSSLNADRAVQSSGTLNINSGIILNSATADKMTSTEYPYTIVCSGTVNMDGGIVRAISSDYSTQYGLHTTGTFIMNGGTIEAVGTALYTSDDGTTTISGGTIITGGINNETSRETIKHESTGNLQISGTNSIEVVSKLGSAIANYNNGNVVLSNSNAVVNGAKQAIYITSGKVTINNGVLGNDGKSLEGVDITAGTLEVNGGTIYGINQGIIITGTGNVNIKGGTVGNISNSIDGIDIVSGTLNITNGTVVGKNQGIIVTGGQVTITGGTINGYENSIDNRGGTITLGIKDTSVSTSTPTITATTLALYKESGIINFYDGIIKGATAISGTIDDLPTNYDVVTTTANSIQTATLAKKYYVKYDANGGSGTMANSTHLYGVSKALTANAFTRTGYKFLGWSTSSTATAATYTDKKSVSNLTTTAGATVTLYAVWQGNTYYIKYNPNEGTGTMENSTHIYGTTSTLTKNVFTRKGYSFKGWSISASSTTVTYSDQANVTKATSTADGVYNLYAVWQGNTYYIKYNANGGTGTMANSEHTYGTTSKLTKNTFTRSGYEFKGWAVSSGGTVAYSDQGNVTRATSTAGGVYNLYAVWEQKVIDKLYYSYTVSGTASWGSTVSDKQVQLSIGNLTSGTTSAGSITVYDVPSGATVTILTNGRANSSTGGGDWYPAAKIYSNGTLIKTTSGSTTTITTTASGNLVVQFSESGVSGVTKGGAVVISAIEYNGTTLTLTQK